MFEHSQRKRIKNIEGVKANRHGDSCGWCCIWPFLMLFRFCRGRKNEKKRERGSQGEGRRESWRGSAAGGRRQGWRCAGGAGGGGWCVINQSINVHRVYCGVLWWCMIYFAPMRNCTGGGDAGGGAAGEPGGGTRGGCWQAIPPLRLSGVGTI